MVRILFKVEVHIYIPARVDWTDKTISVVPTIFTHDLKIKIVWLQFPEIVFKWEETSFLHM